LKLFITQNPMKATLEINKNEINDSLLKVINELFDKKVTEIILRPRLVKPEPFESKLSPDQITEQLKASGHHPDLIREIEIGLSESSAYQK
jgi:hypothetical protein